MTFGIEAFQEEQQKAIDMFFEGNGVSVSLPTGYGISLVYQAAPVIDLLSSLDETGHHIYLHDKHEEFLVEKSSFILCTFVYPRCYGRLKYSKIQRTNGIENIVYFTRVVTNERKFS